MHSRLFVVSSLLVAVSLCLLSCTDAQGFTVGPSTHPVPVLQSSMDRISSLASDMYSRWEALDAACDPKAVFAVAYLYMTASAKTLIANNYFDDGNKMTDFIETFAGRYISAFDNWAAGNQANVSAPWAVYFSFCESNRSDTTQDLTLGMNAHINFDLGVAAYEEGYAVPEWQDDYYRVNDLMADIDNNVTHALGRYDAQFYNTDWLSEAYFQASIDFVTSWRTTAYVSALAYQNALTPDAAQLLIDADEATVSVVAAGLAIPYLIPTAPSRIAYCQENHYPLVV